ncbi:HNH endonuclease family protein [Nonomuraea dietziae]|uniref:HNH endonuclease family protein n=1 Tax=Nonomuraea dietziae TaxID=65515 RepID=UPI0033C0A970
MNRKLLVGLASLALVTGCGPTQAADLESDAGKPPSADIGKARDDLKKLAVKGRAPKTGFEREKFGPAWADVDRNGCDTRNDILKRDLREETFKKGTHDCIVLTGILDDPYSGKTIKFTRGQDTSMAVQIDHLIPLSDAWQKGAQQWSKDKRKEFANDPLNLLAVDGPLNNQKSDADAATWLPPRKAYRCAYIARQVQVKTKYALWVTAAEKAAMDGILSSC